jgi:putative ABC transport system permease protein
MFFRVSVKAMTHRRGRAAIALASLTIAAAITAAMLSVYIDANQKMRREFRRYGANVTLSPTEGESFLDENVIYQISGSQWPVEIIGAAPYLYLVVAAKSGGEGNMSHAHEAAVVVAGTWFDQVKKVNPWWEIKGSWIEARDDDSNSIIGAKVAQQLGVSCGQTITVSYGGLQQKTFNILGVVSTGADEDDRIFISLSAAQKLAKLAGRVSAVALSAVGGASQIENFIEQVNARFDSIKARPIRQIAESEGRVLIRLRSMMLLVTALILALGVLSVATTLAALVIERRYEIGTMKAIGAEDSHLLLQFISELGSLGLISGLIGYVLGVAAAQAIGHSLFNSAVAPRFVVFITVMLISPTVALMGGLIPMKRITEARPAEVLRGD